MRLLRFLLERYDGRIKQTEFFVNPSQREFRELNTDTIRFIAFPDKREVYIFNGNKVIHSEVMAAYFKLPWANRYSYLFGVAELKGGKAVMVSSDEFEASKLNTKSRWCKTLRQDWTWLERYISVKEWFKSNMKDIEKACSSNG